MKLRKTDGKTSCKIICQIVVGTFLNSNSVVIQFAAAKVKSNQKWLVFFHENKRPVLVKSQVLNSFGE